MKTGWRPSLSLQPLDQAGDFLADDLPRIAFGHQEAAVFAQAAALGRVGQEPDQGVGKLRRGVGDQDIFPIGHIQALGADRGGDDRLAHGHGLQDLETRAAADPQGNDHHRGPLDIRGDLRNGPGDRDRRVGLGQGLDHGPGGLCRPPTS